MSKYIFQIPRFSFDQQSVAKLISDVLANQAFKDDFVREVNSADATVRRQRESTSTYGYEEGATTFHQIFCHQTDFFEQLKTHTGLNSCVASMIVKKPGNMIGWHVDTFYKFRTQLCEFDETRFEIIRYMYFPLRSSRGQAFCVEGEWVTDWRAGDGLTWHPSSGHCGVNAGTEVTATINCTGLIEKEKFQKLFLV